MPTAAIERSTPDRLVRENGVKGSVYRDPEIFEKELDRIWYKVWVYVGHESEVPEAGDYVRRQIGLQPVIMVRGKDGKVRVFFNRCRHRGNMVCLSDKGNARKFTCPYHAWTYADSGELIEPTFEEGYDSDLKKADYGLTPLARQDSYRGLVFASVATDGPTLKDHLGGITEFIDLFMDLSPDGEIQLDAGVQKVSYKGNWKFMPENSMEGDYHGPFIHKVAFDLYAKQTGFDVGDLHADEVPDVILSIPGGHMVEDYRGAPMAPRKGTPSAERLEYIRRMKEKHGEAKAAEMLSTMAPLLYVFPNLLYIITHIRVIQPVCPDLSNSYYYPVMLKGAPDEINNQRLGDHEFMMGAGGFVSPDDLEIMDRSQAAMQATRDDWLLLARGLHREHTLPDGGQGGYTMDETHLRGFWRHYASLMEDGR